MKNLRYIFSALAVLAAVSCSNDEYKPGEPDRADSYDVFFDAGQSQDLAFDKDEKKLEVEITATRNNTAEAISVPVVIKGDNSVVFATPLEFNAGQSSSSFKLVFDGLEIQKQYDFLVSIEDPKYALIYGLEATTVTLSVVKEDYEKKFDGTYTCGILNPPANAFGVTVEYSPVLDKYRVNNTWDVQGGMGGEPIVFNWDGKSETVTMDKGATFNTGIDYDGAGNYIQAVYAAAQYFPKEKSFAFVFEYTIPGIGAFGAVQDQLVLR